MADINEIIKEENLVYSKSKILTDNIMSYCPGCTHGVVHKLVAEVIEEMNIQEKTIGVCPVGCSVLAYKFLNIDIQQASHGRAPAVATAVARLKPDKYVFTYQGDGDLASIGTGEIIHACNRGENIVVIFINNGIYGMTGGQMAPTSLIGMPTSTSPYGRDAKLAGNPLKITELIAQLPGTTFVTRQAAHTPAAVRKCKKAILKAFENVGNKKGTSFIEVVSTCSSGWKLSPVKSNEWMVEHMLPFYQLGDLKDE
ncbi:MAG: 2-oxoglutarate oxidoreductase [Bacteroidales bacterium]|nr:2-oxoglutarate oxidoreductase [Bacteroidales bacterium]